MTEQDRKATTEQEERTMAGQEERAMTERERKAMPEQEERTMAEQEKGAMTKQKKETAKTGELAKRVVIGCLAMLLSGCILLGVYIVFANARKGQDASVLTPGETAECVMESLKTLDLEQFNEYTDNYVETWHNWLGIPVESEYRVFNALLQPGAKRGYRKANYEFNYKLNEKIMEYLVWKIEDVRENGSQAEIDMSITNLDMSLVTARYEIYLWENILESAESGKTGLGQMIKDISRIADDEGGLISIIEACSEEDMCTFQVTVTAYQEDDMWRLHLDEEFINAILGNINEEVYPEELQKRIEELEAQYEGKLDEWEAKFTEKMENWGMK